MRIFVLFLSCFYTDVKNEAGYYCCSWSIYCERGNITKVTSKTATSHIVGEQSNCEKKKWPQKLILF